MKSSTKLKSVYADGIPSKFWQKTIGKMYPIIIAVSAAAGIAIYKNTRQLYNTNRLLLAILIGAVVGWAWNHFTILYDRSMAGWEYMPWSVVGLSIAGMPIEDYLFYVIFGAVFIFIKSSIPDIGQNGKTAKTIAIATMASIAAATFFIFGPGGKSISIAFAIPGIVMLAMSRQRFSLARFAIVGVVVVMVGAAWDMLATNIVPNVNGMAWASQWVYVGFDSGGVPVHSLLWLDYSQCKWAWIGRVPIEIAFWFNCAGWWFIYGLSEILHVERKG